MAESVTSPAEQVFPPRLWWLKRFAVVIALCIAALVCFRYLALYVAKHRLAAQIAAIKAAGEPLFPEDFLDQPAPPDQDAGPDLLAAGKLFVAPPPSLTAWNQFPSSFLVPIQQFQLIDALFSANSESLAKVRSARGKRIVNWGLDTSPIQDPAVRFPVIQDMRQLVKLLALAAHRAQSKARTDEAMEYLRDWLTVSRSLESQPFMNAHLWSVEMQQDAAKLIAAWAPYLAIGESPGHASDAQVRGLIADLLDDRETPRSGRLWAWHGERMMHMPLIETLASDERPHQPATGDYRNYWFAHWWMRPAAVDDARSILDRCNMCVKAAGVSDHPEAMKIISEWENKSALNMQMSKYSPIRSNLSLQFETVYYRRRAAVALAVRMFQMKYRRDPTRMAELVPEFLPQAPVNCLRGGGAVMRLR